MEKVITLYADGKYIRSVINVVFSDDSFVVYTFGEDQKALNKNDLSLGKKYNIKICTNGMTIKLTDSMFILYKIKNNEKEAIDQLIPITYKYYFSKIKKWKK